MANRANAPVMVMQIVRRHACAPPIVRLIAVSSPQTGRGALHPLPRPHLER